MKFLITCPNCGRQLFSSRNNCDIDIKCPKCRKFFAVQCDSAVIKVMEKKMEYDACK